MKEVFFTRFVEKMMYKYQAIVEKLIFLNYRSILTNVLKFVISCKGLLIKVNTND